MKEYFRKKYPKLFIKLRSIKDQAMIECRTISSIGFVRILTILMSKSEWQKQLPVQSVQRYDFSDKQIHSIDELCSKLDSYSEGSHSIYLSPSQWESSLLSDLKKLYPNNNGIKIMKRPGDIKEPYVTKSNSSFIQEKFLPNHKNQILVLNFLSRKKISPKLCDVVEISLSDTYVFVAYILQDVSYENSDSLECEKIIDKLKTLMQTKSLALINWNGFEDNDFLCPTCNGNLRKDENGKLLYVDTQNFRLLNYEKELLDISRQAEKHTHYGDKSYVLGGKYLYQAFPGLNVPAKRNPEKRMDIILSLLCQNNIHLRDRLVIDIGCNLGLMGAQYLKNNCYWYHGFDYPTVINHSEQVMSVVGCTRYSFTGEDINIDTDIKNIPEFLAPLLNESVISYLSIRKHIGWLKSLSEFKWKYMFYEGHEDENKEDNNSFINEFNTLNRVSIVSDTFIKDGTSRPRYFAILKNEM